MLHDSRRWSALPQPYASAEEMFERFSLCDTWTLCSAFWCNDILWLNDSFSEDSAQEYAVCRICHDYGDGRLIVLQLESITTSWCTLEKLIDYHKQAIDGVFDETPFGAYTVYVDRSPAHRCALCA